MRDCKSAVSITEWRSSVQEMLAHLKMSFMALLISVWKDMERLTSWRVPLWASSLCMQGRQASSLLAGRSGHNVTVSARIFALFMDEEQDAGIWVIAWPGWWRFWPGHCPCGRSQKASRSICRTLWYFHTWCQGLGKVITVEIMYCSSCDKFSHSLAEQGVQVLVGALIGEVAHEYLHHLSGEDKSAARRLWKIIEGCYNFQEESFLAYLTQGR